MEELSAALAQVVRAGIAPNKAVIHPDMYRALFQRKIVLKDQKVIHISDEDYKNYMDTFNPPEWDTYEEYLDKKMIVEL